MRVRLEPSASIQDSSRILIKILIVFVLVVVTYFIQLMLRPLLGLEAVFLLYLPVITIGAWFGGLRIGLLATIIATLLSLSVFQWAGGALLRPDWPALVPLGLFVVEGVLISGLMYRLRLTQKHTLSALQTNLHRYQIAMENARVSIYTNDRDLRYTWVQNTHPDFPAEKMLGKRDDELLPRASVAELIALKQRVLATGRGVKQHITTTIGDELCIFAVTVEPLHDPTGSTEGLLVAAVDVTETWRARDALRESEEKFRVALKNAPIMVAQVDRDLRYTWIHNPHPAFEPADVIGKRDDELNSDEGTQQLMALKQRVLETGIGARESITFDVDGERAVYKITAEALHNADGEVVGVTTASMDVTGYEQLLSELRESEELRRLALEAAEMGTWINEVDGSYAYWDAQARRIFGVGDAPATVEKGLEIIAPEDRAIAESAFAKAIAPGSSGIYAVEKRIVLPDASIRWVATRGQIIYRGENGARQPWRLVGVVTDITNRKRIEEALRESLRDQQELTRSVEAERSRLAAVLENLPVGVWITDRGGRIITTNPEAHRVWQGQVPMSESPDAYGEYLCWWPDTGKRVTNQEMPLALVLKTHARQSEVEFRIQRFDDSTGYIAVSAAPIFDPHGNMLGAVGISLDTTDRKQAAEALNQERELLQRIINKIPVMITVYDPNTNVTFVNHEFERLVGWGTQEALEHDMMTLVYPDRDYREQVRDYMQSLQPGWRDFKVTARDGSIIDSSWSNVQLSDGRQVGIGIDIRERLKAEQRGHLLQTLAAALSGAITQHEVTEIIIEHGIRGLEAAGGTIVVLTGDGQSLEIIGALGYPPEIVEKWRHIPLDHPTVPIALAVRENRTLWMGSPAERERIIPHTSDLSSVETHQAWAVLPFNVNNDMIGAVGLGFDAPRDFDETERAFLLTLTEYCAQALERAHLTEQTRELAAMEERQRLSRDLHDSVKQILFASTTRADLLSTIWDDPPPKARKYLEDVIFLNRAALAEMQTLLLEMRPDAIMGAPFMSLVENLCHGLRGHKQIMVSIDGPDEVYLPGAVHVALYRLAQEALNNVIKHSQASQLTVTGQYDETQFRLIIHDDGVGFDPEEINSGFGLKMMRERAEAVGAAFEIRSGSQDKQGTRITVTWQAAKA